MATPWGVAMIGWGITVLGWLLSPIIALFLSKILSYLGFDASQKLRELEIHIIPELMRTLRHVEEQRMLRQANRETSSMTTLCKLAVMLKHALYEAEDILDLIDYHQIERKVIRDVDELCGSSWPLRLYGTVTTSIACCRMRCLGIVPITRGRSAQLLHWAQMSSLCRFLCRSDHVLPITTSAAPSVEPAPVATTSDKSVPLTSAAPSVEPAPVATTSDKSVPVTSAAPSDSPGRWLSCLCSSFDFFCYYCRSILYWLVDAIEVARRYRNWSYDVVGISSCQDNATALDFLLPAISRWNLKKRVEKVESIVTEVKNSPLLDVARNIIPDDIVNMNRSKIRSTIKREVFGRKVLRDNIMAKMLSEAQVSGSHTCYSVIGIYGIAGSGKTTLARYVLDYIKEYKDKRFDTIMCVHVSETFSVDDIFHDMLKDITNADPNIKDRGGPQAKLEEILKDKRFFLILDDLWVKNNNYQELKELLSPLNVGKEGSKILLTARREDTVRALGAHEPIAISDLDEDQYYRMFMHYALDGTGIHDEEFRPVGRKIAKKLHRSPIAAVTVAGQLRGKPHISFWKTTAELDVLNGTMGALWWSYMQLDVDIRRCFEYCNIFPRRFKLKRDELVRLWIAQGFVKTSCATEDMEDLAVVYVQELVTCSFLQPEGTSACTDYFTIHDLLHDLADKVAGNDCFRIENARSQRGEGWKGDVPRDVRHLFVQNYDGELITEKILELENLRTLIICDVGRLVPVKEKVLESIFKGLHKLRVLAISLSQKSYELIEQPKMISVPQFISQLKHLRYLALRTGISCTVTLPSAPTNLYHIQVLDFGQCLKLEFSAAEVINLRHVFCLSDLDFPNIGRLISLQTVPEFRVRNEQGYEVNQLKDLNKLRGSLEIEGLDNVRSKEEALEANLAAKERLTELILQWDWKDTDTRCNLDVESEVLEGLCPPAGLEKLGIWHYGGLRYPDWMVGKEHNGGPKDLRQLWLYFWSQLGPAPELEAFVHLRSLELWHCSWEALPGNMEHLTSLKSLCIFGCLNIRSLPTLPLSLEEFTLECCDDEFTKSCKTVGHPNWQKIVHVPKKKWSVKLL